MNISQDQYKLHNPKALSQISECDRPYWKRMLAAFRGDIQRQATIPPSVKFARWTPETSAELMRLLAEGKSYKEIRNITGRPIGGVKHQITKLRGSFP